MPTVARGTARFTMSGPGVDLDMAIPLPLAEEILLIMVVERPYKPLAGDTSLGVELERHAPTSERERVLVVMAWHEAQGHSSTRLSEINAALKAAGEPAIRYAGCVTHAVARGECRPVHWAEYQLTEGGRQLLAVMQTRRSAPTEEEIATTAKALVIQKQALDTPDQTENAESPSTSGGSARKKRARRAARGSARSRRAA